MNLLRPYLQIIQSISLILLSSFSYGQSDTSFYSKKIIPRFAVHGQKTPSFEVDLFLQNFSVRSSLNGRHKYYQYSSAGFYAGSEFIFQLDKPIYGPKIGAEFSGVGRTSGSAFGLELIAYTDLAKTDFCFTPKIGIPLNAFNIFYAYSIYTSRLLDNQIGRHRISLSLNLNRKATKNAKRIYNEWRSGLKKEL